MMQGFLSNRCEHYIEVPQSEFDNLYPEVERAIEAIEHDRVSGASTLSAAALKALALAAEVSEAETSEGLLRDLFAAAKRVASSKPSMASLANSVSYVAYSVMKRVEGGIGLQELKKVVKHSTSLLSGEVTAGIARVVESALPLLRPISSIVTISYSNTVAEAVIRSEVQRIYVAESRPKMEGRELARRLANAGLNTVLVTDAAAPQYAIRSKCVVLGADSVFSNGVVVNKAGSLALAMVAKSSDVPVYVLFDKWKLVPHGVDARAYRSEQGEADEVAPLEELKGVTVENPYFDAVPPNLITLYLSEFGPLREGDLARRAAEFSPMRKALDL